jgi:hypothetical protein
MAGLVPAIYVLLPEHENKDVDARPKAGHDVQKAARDPSRRAVRRAPQDEDYSALLLSFALSAST